MILDKLPYVLLGSITNSMKGGMIAQHLVDHMAKSRTSKMLEIHFDKNSSMKWKVSLYQMLIQALKKTFQLLPQLLSLQ